MKTGGVRVGAGRPTKLSSQTESDMLDYFASFDHRLDEQIDKGGKVADIPTFHGFCREISVSRSTRQGWEAKSKSFAKASDKCRAIRDGMFAKASRAGIAIKADTKSIFEQGVK